MDRRFSGRLMLGGILGAWIALVALAPPEARAADDISGPWEISQNFYGLESYSTLQIDRATSGSQSGALAGKWNGEPVSNLKFDGSVLAFDRTPPVGGADARMSFSGKLVDGKFIGKVSGSFGSFDTDLSRAVPLHPAMGNYPVKFRSKLKGKDVDVFDTITLTRDSHGALSGAVATSSGMVLSFDLQYADGKLTAKTEMTGFLPKFQAEWRPLLEATLIDGKLKGILKRPGEPDVAISSERYGAEAIGEWEITGNFPTPPNVRKLIVYPDLSGRFQLYGGLSPIAAPAVEQGVLSFINVVPAVGANRTVRFTGFIKGDAMNGDIVGFERDINFTGKRIGPAK